MTREKHAGGRPKGSRNKRTESVTQELDAKGANPIKILSDLLLKAVKNEDDTQAAYLAVQLAPYHSPKLTAAKVTAEVVGITYEEKLVLLAKESDL